MKKTWRVIRETMKFSFRFAPMSYFFLLLLTITAAVLKGPILTQYTQIIYDFGAEVALKKRSYPEFLPYVLIYGGCMLLPSLLGAHSHRR